MGIINDYLGSSSTNEPDIKSAPVKGSSIINDYLSAEPDQPKRIYVSPAKPPISGVSKEQSDIINAEPGIKGEGPTTPDFPDIKQAIGDKFVEGLKEAGSGVNDIFNKQPATGFGKIGTGLLSSVTSIPTGTGEFVGKLTGNEDLGSKIPLLFGAVPVAKGASVVANKLPANESLRKLVSDIGEQNLPTVVSEMKSNPRLTPADLSPSVRQGVQKLYAGVEGPHVDYIANATQQRLDTAAKDLEHHMNTNLGNVVDPVAKIDALTNKIKAVGATQINPVVKAAKPVDLTDTIKNIDNILKPGVNSVVSHEAILADPNIQARLKVARKYLTDDQSMLTDAEKLNRIQSMFRSAGEKLIRSPETAEAGKALLNVRQDIITAIDKASPQVEGKGTYRPALSKYRDEFDVKDAFEHGHDAIMKNGKNLQDRPEFFEKWVKNAGDDEIEAAKEGARVAYDTQMNAFKHAARRGTDIGDVEFNRRRMTALFGKDEAEKMFKTFEDAKKVADTNNKLVQGSQTQMRNVQDSYFKPYDPHKADSTLSNVVNVGIPLAAEAGSQFLGGPGGVGAIAGTAALLAGKGISKGASAAKTAVIQKLERERNMRYAKYALPMQGPDRDALIQQLDAIANAPPKKSLLSKGAGLARLIAP